MDVLCWTMECFASLPFSPTQWQEHWCGMQDSDGGVQCPASLQDRGRERLIKWNWRTGRNLRICWFESCDMCHMLFAGDGVLKFEIDLIHETKTPPNGSDLFRGSTINAINCVWLNLSSCWWIVCDCLINVLPSTCVRKRTGVEVGRGLMRWFRNVVFRLRWCGCYGCRDAFLFRVGSGWSPVSRQ